MANTLDIKYINPFLKATISIFEMLGLPGGKVGRPSIRDLDFPADTFLIQVGVTGGMKGQVFFGLTEEKACRIASVMMMGAPVETLDAMACSALQELGNMILGNTSTLFSNMNIIFDITPPISMHGKNIRIHSDIPTIAVPVNISEEEYVMIYLSIEEA